MSRVANSPVTVPNGVEVKLDGRDLSVKGSKGTLTMTVDANVEVSHEDNTLTFAAKSSRDVAMSGTTRALVNNMVTGVTDGFERKLVLNGVGYRAAVQGKKLNLTVGLSHPVEYELPEGITAETPSQTEIVLKGIDKQALGLADEYVRRKEAKKK